MRGSQRPSSSIWVCSALVGLRLFSVKDSESLAKLTTDPDLTLLLDAWPVLPERD